MSTTTADIVRWRCILTSVIRIGCVLIGMGAVVPAVSWLHEGVMDGDLFDLSYYAPRVMATFMLLIAGVGGPLLAPLIVRLSMPLVEGKRCPKCGYAVESESCPECGLDVSGLLEPSTPLLNDMQWRSRTLYIMTTVSRLLALALVVYGVLDLAWWSFIGFMYWQETFADMVEMLIYSTRPLVFIVIGGFWFVLAGPIVGWCLPKPDGFASQRSAGGNHVSGEPSDEDPNEHRSPG